ncbi:hypothetical protein A3762_23635 [Oleiphilus sp. HI0125]|uniref:response regulator n=1 Tax=Oleiphilus sp. HI0125 TaxID=1822266 RepID=UPI0007C3294B|nr:response regulator [Oleiphilus sp. HI0125]KZZ56071.1 hypothetical protein A3762_11615 [Oleiphilus sp. HI0125]KZZ62109.1 hypothetical protein A3762_23635 [Oleiphilus sp. HI0125]
MTSQSALVVDDSSTSRTLLTKILKKKGVHCEQACSGEDALSQLSWFHPDYIFLDHMMPGLDGFQTLERIKNDDKTKHIPVIMYTSQHAHNYYEEAHKLGAAGVISKQIDRDKLYLMLDRICTPKNDDVPLVFNEVHSKVNETIENESSNAKLYARISTLEASYEELLKENRQMKTEISRWASIQAEETNKRSKIALPQPLFIGFLALALFASTFAWLTTQKIDQNYKGTQQQIHQVNELIDEIIVLLEQSNRSR